MQQQETTQNFKKVFEYKKFEFFDGLGTLYARNDKNPSQPRSVGYVKVLKSFKTGELAAEYWRLVSDYGDLRMLGYYRDGEWVSDRGKYVARLDALKRFATLPDVDWDSEIRSFNG